MVNKRTACACCAVLWKPQSAGRTVSLRDLQVLARLRLKECGAGTPAYGLPERPGLQVLRHAFEDTKCRENEAVEAAWLRGPAGLRHEAALHYEAAKHAAGATHGRELALVGPAYQMRLRNTVTSALLKAYTSPLCRSAARPGPLGAGQLMRGVPERQAQGNAHCRRHRTVQTSLDNPLRGWWQESHTVCPGGLPEQAGPDAQHAGNLQLSHGSCA